MNNKGTPPPTQLSTISRKLLSTYVVWYSTYTTHIPKSLRYSLGIKIDSIFTEITEEICRAQFSQGDKRIYSIVEAISSNDTLKFMLMALHELKGIDNSKFLCLSASLEEIGKMLFGWKLYTEKQNHLSNKERGGNT